MRPDIHDEARGKWRGILPALGVPSQFLNGKHQPCPLCGGKDRARFTDWEGTGGYICNQCGSGNGVDLLMKLHGWDFKEAVAKIREIAGTCEAGKPPEPMPEWKRKQALRELWKGSRPVAQGDHVDRYLHSRGVGFAGYPEALRTADGMMLAVVSDKNGNPATLHRTYIVDGKRTERKLMPGSVPKGGAVRLKAPVAGILGIAEGIETALAASRLFGTPVWAAINSSLMEQWEPPEGIDHVMVYGDNDPKFGGQKAAYTLAHRLAVRGYDVGVGLPNEPGTDWNDALNAQPNRSPLPAREGETAVADATSAE